MNDLKKVLSSFPKKFDAESANEFINGGLEFLNDDQYLEFAFGDKKQMLESAYEIVGGWDDDCKIEMLEDLRLKLQDKLDDQKPIQFKKFKKLYVDYFGSDKVQLKDDQGFLDYYCVDSLISFLNENFQIANLEISSSEIDFNVISGFTLKNDKVSGYFQNDFDVKLDEIENLEDLYNFFVAEDAEQKRIQDLF